MISSCGLALLQSSCNLQLSECFQSLRLGISFHMKIFSEFIIDSCFKNLSEYCTCSIFRMISASIFAIVILHHVPCKIWLNWAPPTFSTRGCLWKSSILAISTRFLDFSNTDFGSNTSTQMGFYQFGKISKLAHDRG